MKFILLNVLVLSALVACVPSEQEAERALENYRSNDLYLVTLRKPGSKPTDYIATGHALYYIHSHSELRNRELGAFLAVVGKREIISVDSSFSTNDFSIDEVQYSKEVDDIMKQSGIEGLLEKYFPSIESTVPWGNAYLAKILILNGKHLRIADLSPAIYVVNDEQSTNRSGRILMRPE